MTDTSVKISNTEFKKAEIAHYSNNSITSRANTNSHSVSTSRREGVLKLRIASREIPERKTTITTETIDY